MDKFTKCSIRLVAERIFDDCETQLSSVDLKNLIKRTMKQIIYEDENNILNGSSILIVEDCLKQVGTVNKISDGLDKLIHLLNSFVPFKIFR